MANLFTAEQLAYLDKRYAKIPHDHTWEQVKDIDGKTLMDRVMFFDKAIADIEEELDSDDGKGAQIDLDEGDEG
jgi:hypothetical protein